MFQPGILGFCRNILLSYLPFIGGFTRAELPVRPGLVLAPVVIASKTFSIRHGLQPAWTDYRPVRLFGKVVAINFARGLI